MKHSRLANLTLMLSILSVALCTASADAQQLYHNITLIDVANRDHVKDAYLIVEDGTITAVGHGQWPQTFSGTSMDMEGAYAMPGLIDGHAHITAGPHKIEVVDGAPMVTIDSIESVTRYNALMALAFGVTSVRNPGGDPVASHHYDQMIQSGQWLGPRALHAGAVAQPAPFGGDAFVHPTTPEAWNKEAKRQADLGMHYMKLYIGLSEDELANGIEAAHRHGLKAIAHLDQVSWLTALELGIDGLEHALPTSADLLPDGVRDDFDAMRATGSQYMAKWFEWVDYDSPQMQLLFNRLAEQQVTLNLTLLVNEMLANADDLSQVIDPQSERHLHPETWRATKQFLEIGASTWSEDDFASARKTRSKVLMFAKRVFEAGIPLLIGTDGNGGGPLMALEMQLHVDAGLSSWDVLDLATRQAAKVMNLGKTGSIEPGYEADIMFVNADPIADVAAVAKVHSVIVDGSFYRHDELVTRAKSMLRQDNTD